MRIRNEELKENYHIIPNEYLKDKRLGLKAVGIMTKLYSLPNDWEFSMEGLSKIMRTGISAIRSGIAELELYGYIFREEKRNDKGQIEYIWHLLTKPKKANWQNQLRVRMSSKTAKTACGKPACGKL